VRKEFSLSRLALCALCVLSLFGLGACGQVGALGQQSALGQVPVQTQTNEHPNGLVQDWTNHHVVYPRFGPAQTLIALQNDPRAVQSWQAAARADWRRYNSFRFPNRTHTSLHLDWSIGLGAGGTAPAMFPAKFTFDTTAAPTCIISTTSVPPVPIPDFIVFTVNVAGGINQPNIVAFQDLYSGPGPSGICSTQRPTYFTLDNAASAATFWSYNITAADGVVSTSPALSLDGTKVAFVEKGSGTQAHFHVLAYHGGTSSAAGDGVDINNSQNVLGPASITNSFVTLAPAAGSGTATDLALNVGTTQSDTLSSPFVDYADDVAYIGNDSGVLFRVKNVFCTNVCTVGVTAAPSLDTTWPTSGGTAFSGTLATGCPGKLTGPVQDRGTGNVFVGCSDGTLYGFTPSGSAIPGSPLTVGTLFGPTGGIVDPPLVDVVNGLLYVVAGNAGSGSGAPSVLVQTGTTSFLTPTPVTAFLGAGGHFNLHAPAFNDNYFSNPTSTTWLLYALALDGTGTQSTLYGITFNSSRVMTAGAPTNADVFSFGADEFSPATEFLTTAGEDRLFESFLGSSPGNLASFNISTTFPASLEHFATEGSGTTGIVVDNASASAQADSIYFGALTANTAVKVTQSALQ
jgi:hypothetical protein